MRVLTDWFPGTVKPVREGPYLVEFWRGHQGGVLHWNGSDWLEAPSMAPCPELLRSRWRGLAFNPEAAVPWIYDGIYLTKRGNEAWIVEMPR